MLKKFKFMDYWIKWIWEYGGLVLIYLSMVIMFLLMFFFDKIRKIERGIEKKIIIVICY